MVKIRCSLNDVNRLLSDVLIASDIEYEIHGVVKTIGDCVIIESNKCSLKCVISDKINEVSVGDMAIVCGKFAACNKNIGGVEFILNHIQKYDNYKTHQYLLSDYLKTENLITKIKLKRKKSWPRNVNKIYVICACYNDDDPFYQSMYDKFNRIKGCTTIDFFKLTVPMDYNTYVIKESFEQLESLISNASGYNFLFIIGHDQCSFPETFIFSNLASIYKLMTLSNTFIISAINSSFALPLINYIVDKELKFSGDSINECYNILYAQQVHINKIVNKLRLLGLDEIKYMSDQLQFMKSSFEKINPQKSCAHFMNTSDTIKTRIMKGVREKRTLINTYKSMLMDHFFILFKSDINDKFIYSGNGSSSVSQEN